MTFGEKIQALRKKAGLSQEELADRLDITRQTVSKWELDQSTPELGYIAKIADMYGVTTDYLIKDGDETFENEKKDTASEVVPFFVAETRKSSAPVIALGMVLCALGVIGILTFVVLSAVHPWGVVNELGSFSGLLGFLFGTKTVWAFAIFVLLAISGVAILTVLALKSKKTK